jgi:hypothetical protein
MRCSVSKVKSEKVLFLTFFFWLTQVYLQQRYFFDEFLGNKNGIFKQLSWHKYTMSYLAFLS